MKNELLPKSVKAALQEAQEKMDASIAADAIPPELPRTLPPLIKLLTSKVPLIYKPAVAMAVFPPLGVHLNRVRFKYIDNVDHEPVFMSLLMAKQSIGKSSVNKPIDYIMADIDERDKEMRQREMEWKEAYRQRGVNKEKPKRPNDMVVQMMMSNTTNAALVQRLIDAEKNGDRFLYSRMDEVELLKQIHTTGGAGVSELIRLGYDCARYGQERVGVDSVSGTPKLRWNWNASTTIEGGQRFFRNGLQNGTLSRITLSTIMQANNFDNELPVFEEYDEAFAEELRPFISRLNEAEGLICSENANRLAHQLLKENNEVAVLSEDENYITLGYRANVSAFLRAMVLYVAHDGWSGEMEDFVRWSERYDLWCKVHFFGKMMQKSYEDMVAEVGTLPRNMLELLPSEFTTEDLVMLRNALGKRSNPYPILGMWTKRGYIAKTEKGVYIKRKR